MLLSKVYMTEDAIMSIIIYIYIRYIYITYIYIYIFPATAINLKWVSRVTRENSDKVAQCVSTWYMFLISFTR